MNGVVIFFYYIFSQRRPMQSVSMFCSACKKDVIKANLYRKLKTEMCDAALVAHVLHQILL